MLRRNSAFTLIELLVVVSIIALLVSILMPALAKAREQGQRALCLVHTKGMTTGWLLYASDNDDKLVSGKTRPIRQLGSTNPPVFEWNPVAVFNGDPAYYPDKTWIGYWGINPASPQPALDIPAREATVTIGLMYPYIEELGIYKCPTVRNEEEKSSYSIMDAMNGHYTTATVSHGGKVFTKLPEITSPSERIVFVCEGDGAQDMGQSWAPLDLENNDLAAGEWPGFWDYAPILHSEGAIFSFADGHAEYHLWTDPRTIGDADGSIPRPTTSGIPLPQTNNDDVAWLAQYGWGINTLY